MRLHFYYKADDVWLLFYLSNILGHNSSAISLENIYICISVAAIFNPEVGFFFYK